MLALLAPPALSKAEGSAVEGSEDEGSLAGIRHDTEMSKLLRQVGDAIRRGRLLEPGMRVAVACSGGADSAALLLLLRELKAELGIHLLVAHLNHQLRGRAADADEAFVHALAKRLGLEFIAERVDVAARARNQRMNLEEAGRQARLEFFGSLCALGKADAVAVAHTLDDQAETLLARLVRGTGLTGVAGIQPLLELNPGRPDGRPSGRIVRPLLGVRRADLRALLRRRKQKWREDASNLDRTRTRNRIRLELVPQLERLSPAAVTHLARLAAQARQEEDFWQVFTEERFRALACPERSRGAQQQGGEWRIAASAVREPLGDLYSAVAESPRLVEAAQRAVAQRLVRRLVEAVRGSARRLTEKHIEQVLRLAHAGRGGQQAVLPSVRVERSFDWLVFHTGRRAAASYSYEVTVPGRVEIEAARQRLQFKLIAASDLPRGYNGDNRAALDADALPGGRTARLTVRNWRRGDRYQALGSARPKKLKALFQRAQVPAGERARYPVVVSAGEIVWVPRFGIAAGCAVGERTRTVLLIEEEPLPEMTR